MNERDRADKAALDYATNIDIIQLLLDNSAKLDLDTGNRLIVWAGRAWYRNRQSDASVYGRRHLHLVDTLLVKGAPKEKRASALIRGAAMDDLFAVKGLLASGANPNSKDAFGQTALMWATLMDRAAMVKAVLAKGGRVDACNLDGNSALIYAVEFRYADTVKALLAGGADPNTKHELDIVKALLDGGADPNVGVKPRSGQTPFMSAVEQGWTDIVKAMLAKGADVNARTDTGWSAMSFARLRKRTAIIRLLEQAGAKE